MGVIVGSFVVIFKMPVMTIADLEKREAESRPSVAAAGGFSVDTSMYRFFGLFLACMVDSWLRSLWLPFYPSSNHVVMIFSIIFTAVVCVLLITSAMEYSE